MISVVINKNRNNEYVGFSCKGHAGFDDAGKDVVCAAVSMLVINTINSIETLTNCKFDASSDSKKGIIEIAFKDTVSKEAALLLDAMVLGIDTVSKEYGKSYVKLNFKEV